MVWAADIQPRVLQRTIGARVQRVFTHAGAGNTHGAIFKGTSPLTGFDVTRLQEVEVETLVHRKDLQGRCADHQRILLPMVITMRNIISLDPDQKIFRRGAPTCGDQRDSNPLGVVVHVTVRTGMRFVLAEKVIAVVNSTIWSNHVEIQVVDKRALRVRTA